MTSTDLPTHLPGSFRFDRDAPQDTRIDLNAPATNTVRFADSHLVVPVSGPVRRTSPAAAPSRRACRPASRRVRLRARRRAVLRVTVTKRGRRARGAVVTLRGRGMTRRVRTNRRGRAVIRVTPRRSGRYTVATRSCGLRLSVSRRVR